MNQAFLDSSPQLCRTQHPASRQTPQETSNKLKDLSAELAQCRAPKITCRKTKAFTWTETSDQSLSSGQRLSAQQSKPLEGREVQKEK